jgi:hypothetical protein
MKRVRVDGLLAKIETVEGTDAVPSPATDGIQLDEHMWASIETDYLERNLRENATGNRMGRNSGAQPAAPWAKLTVTVALKGAGVAYAAGVRPEMDVLLRACGLAATVDATADAEKCTYAPIDTNHEAATLYAYAAGSLYKILGAHGQITGIAFLPARIALVTIELTGVLPGVPTDAAIPNIVYARRSVQPPVVKAEALTLNGVGVLYKSVNWSQNSVIAALPRGGAPEGHAGYAITDYDPRFKAQIDSPDKSTLNPWALERAGTEFPWSIDWGQTQYNKGTISGSNGQIIHIPQSEDSGYAIIEPEVRCLHGDAEDAFTIEFN